MARNKKTTTTRTSKAKRDTATMPLEDGEDFSLETQSSPKGQFANAEVRASTKAKPAAGKKGDQPAVLSYRHADKRKNNPEVGMVRPENDPDEPHSVWKYDPHLDPALQFDIGRSQIEKLIDDALGSGDKETMLAALRELKRLQQPYLNWTGKAERTSFEFDTVSLHVHERIDPASILANVRKRMKDAKGNEQENWKQPDLFAAPFENLPLRDAIDFYKHERGWANRLIAGDSLLVMNSLLQKESLAGQVQMIYIDPPYGIKYGSNFQPFVNKRDVKDRKDEDLTQEPEMIKAFRDTWELGIHSYLTYLRDRLLLAKDLLHESGSVFVQISDENLHLVRQILDEIFGVSNFLGQIAFIKTAALVGTRLSSNYDYILWCAKDSTKTKYNQLFVPKKERTEFGTFSWLQKSNGQLKKLSRAQMRGEVEIPEGDRYRASDITGQGESSTSDAPIIFEGRAFSPSSGRHWSSNQTGMNRLIRSGRVMSNGSNLAYKRFEIDYPVMPIVNVWDDTIIGTFTDKIYVVQTGELAVERCLLMTTDPGDLVLDPTCGSGTTAFVAEKWGRRWITADTSRVSVTLAKQRLMTASYDYYELKYPQEGLKSGFIYKTVPHVTLKSIANNPEIDEIYERMHPAIEAAMMELNNAAKQKMKEWEVPFDIPEDWPKVAHKAFDAFHAARQALQKKMDDSIAAHADQETLYDQPTVSKNKLRITGPFTVEGPCLPP